jgi:antitoxin ParD1/3/4
MPTMNVSLSSELLDFVEGEISSGEYGTASEVVRDGLRLLLRDKESREAKLAVLRREVGLGVQQVRAKRFSKRSITEIGSAVRKAIKRS